MQTNIGFGLTARKKVLESSICIVDVDGRQEVESWVTGVLWSLKQNPSHTLKARRPVQLHIRSSTFVLTYHLLANNLSLALYSVQDRQKTRDFTLSPHSILHLSICVLPQ